MAKRNQQDWSEYQGQLHHLMGAGNLGLAATAYKMLAWILLDEDRPEKALAYAAVAAYIDANGHCGQDFATQKLGYYEPEDIWEPDGDHNINLLFPLAKAARALGLSEEEVGPRFEEGCALLFPDTFGAPLNYSEAWAKVSASKEWKDAWATQ